MTDNPTAVASSRIRGLIDGAVADVERELGRELPDDARHAFRRAMGHALIEMRNITADAHQDSWAKTIAR